MTEYSRAYFKNLDGLRFLAALLVICAHYVTVIGDQLNLSKWSRILLTLDGAGAEVGVNFFFVLSGFLITYLILTDAGETDFTFVKKFYIRRALRIWPLYYLSVAIGFFVYPWLVASPQYVEAASGWMYAFFLANLDQIYFWNSPTQPNILLGVHWSVAVEEQFYLLWPWLFVLFRKGFIWICLCIWIVALAFQAYTGMPSHTISSFQDLALGGVLAYTCVTHREKIFKFFQKIRKPVLLGVYAAGFILLIAKFQLSIHFGFYETIYRPVNAMIFCWVILDQGFNSRSVLPISKIPGITYLGRISYGLYLLHPLALLISKTFLVGVLNSGLIFPIMLLLSVGLASLSYHTYESFFLRLKPRFA